MSFKQAIQNLKDNTIYLAPPLESGLGRRGVTKGDAWFHYVKGNVNPSLKKAKFLYTYFIIKAYDKIYTGYLLSSILKAKGINVKLPLAVDTAKAADMWCQLSLEKQKNIISKLEIDNCKDDNMSALNVVSCFLYFYYAVVTGLFDKNLSVISQVLAIKDDKACENFLEKITKNLDNFNSKVKIGVLSRIRCCIQLGSHYQKNKIFSMIAIIRKNKNGMKVLPYDGSRCQRQSKFPYALDKTLLKIYINTHAYHRQEVDDPIFITDTFIDLHRVNLEYAPYISKNNFFKSKNSNQTPHDQLLNELKTIKNNNNNPMIEVAKKKNYNLAFRKSCVLKDVRILKNVLNIFLKYKDSLININEAGKITGNTALHLIAKSPEKFKIYQLLIENGALENIKNNKGLTPRDIASDKGYQKFIEGNGNNNNSDGFVLK